GGANGLVSFAFAGSEVRSPIAKFLSAEELGRLRSISGAKDGDLVLAVAAEYRVASRSIGAVRQQLGDELKLADESTHHMMWINRFPMFERTPIGSGTFSQLPFDCQHYAVT